jgi:FkbM family methyltransferase
MSANPAKTGAGLTEPMAARSEQTGGGFQNAANRLRRCLVASVTRRYPLFSGCGEVANCRLVRALAGRKKGLDWVRLRQGPYLRVMLGDYLSNTVYFSRDWDRKISWTCERLLRPGDVALDIGANIGLVTCQMAAMVGPTGAVHSFEPNPVVGDLLRQSIARNGFSHVTLHPVALGDAESELELTVPQENHCLGTLTRDTEGAKFTVPVKTLSDWFERSKITRIRLMKIDVEGFEEQVFRGGERFLSAVRPDAILLELNKYEGAFDAHPVIQILRRHGYDFLALPKKLLRMSAKRFDSAGVAGSPSNDLVAAPGGAVFEDVAFRLAAHKSRPEVASRPKEIVLDGPATAGGAVVSPIKVMDTLHRGNRR